MHFVIYKLTTERFAMRLLLLLSLLLIIIVFISIIIIIGVVIINNIIIGIGRNKYICSFSTMANCKAKT